MTYTVTSADLGDSAIVETYGLGALAVAASPIAAASVGLDPAGGDAIDAKLRAIAAGESPDIRYPDGRAAILDPFDGGKVLETGDLRQRLKAVIGDKAELQPNHYAAIGNRDILLRLVNNIKVRLIQDGDLPRAAEMVDRMLLVAPQAPALWRESGLIQSRIGNLLAARAAFTRFLEIADNENQRHQVARLLQELNQRLQ